MMWKLCSIWEGHIIMVLLLDKSIEQAIHYLTLASEQNILLAHRLLAEIYLNNNINSENWESKVILYYERGFENYDLESTYNLALIYERGHIVQQSFDKVNIYYRAAKTMDYKGASSLSTEANYQLGLNFMIGRGLRKNEKTAFLYFKQAADEGHSKAQLEVDTYLRCYSEPPQPQKALEYLSLAAKSGEIEAFLKLAIYYFHGIGVAKSTENELKCLKYAADLNNINALEDLRSHYEIYKDQDSVVFYENKYLILLQNLSDQNDRSAIYDLARFYKEYRYEYEKAIECYLKLCTGNGTYFSQIAECYELLGKTRKALKYYKMAFQQEDGIFKYAERLYKLCDFKKALYYYQLASKDNHEFPISANHLRNIHYRLGRFYEVGMGCLEDNQKALLHYTEAAQKKHLPSICRLAEAHRMGDLGLEKSFEIAFKYYQQAINLGYGTRLFELITDYRYGITGDTCSERAWILCEYLEKNGSPMALYLIAEMYENGFGTPASMNKALKYYLAAAETIEFESYIWAGICLFKNGYKHEAQECFKKYQARSFGHGNSIFLIEKKYGNFNKFLVNPFIFPRQNSPVLEEDGRLNESRFFEKKCEEFKNSFKEDRRLDFTMTFCAIFNLDPTIENLENLYNKYLSNKEEVVLDPIERYIYFKNISPIMRYLEDHPNVTVCNLYMCRPFTEWQDLISYLLSGKSHLAFLILSSSYTSQAVYKDLMRAICKAKQTLTIQELYRSGCYLDIEESHPETFKEIKQELESQTDLKDLTSNVD